MKRISQEFFPKLLNSEQKQQRIEVVQKSLNKVNVDSDLLKRLTTCEETWVYGYDVENKAQSSLWRHSASPKPKIEVKRYAYCVLRF